MCRILPTVVAAIACLTLAASDASGAEASQGKKPAAYAAEMNKQFADPNADIQPFLKRFESDSRDVFAKRREIVRAVRLRPGDTVADIGAGTGLFTFLFAEQVEPAGIVYAVDIGPAFLKHIMADAERQGRLRTVKTVLNTQDSVELPPASIEVAFLCDTYHHFDHPEKMLASLHQALRPGGRLIVIDFDLRPGSGDFVKQRARASREVYCREIEEAGFERVETKDVPAVGDHFFVEFRRTK